MKETRLFLTQDQIKALLDGRKTQHRIPLGLQLLDIIKGRVIDGCQTWVALTERDPNHGKVFRCKWGEIGDRLWVPEKYSYHERIIDPYYLPPDYPEQAMGVHYWADGNPDYGDWTPPKSPVTMPRWAARILLEITNVRVEKLQEIGQQDARDEGVGDWGCDTLEVYQCEWDSIYAKKGHPWENNDWVWVLEWKLLEPELRG